MAARLRRSAQGRRAGVTLSRRYTNACGSYRQHGCRPHVAPTPACHSSVHAPRFLSIYNTHASCSRGIALEVSVNVQLHSRVLIPGHEARLPP